MDLWLPKPRAAPPVAAPAPPPPPPPPPAPAPRASTAPLQQPLSTRSTPVPTTPTATWAASSHSAASVGATRGAKSRRTRTSTPKEANSEPAKPPRYIACELCHVNKKKCIPYPQPIPNLPANVRHPCNRCLSLKKPCTKQVKPDGRRYAYSGPRLKPKATDGNDDGKMLDQISKHKTNLTPRFVPFGPSASPPASRNAHKKSRSPPASGACSQPEAQSSAMTPPYGVASRPHFAPFHSPKPPSSGPAPDPPRPPAYSRKPLPPKLPAPIKPLGRSSTQQRFGYRLPVAVLPPPPNRHLPSPPPSESTVSTTGSSPATTPPAEDDDCCITGVRSLVPPTCQQQAPHTKRQNAAVSQARTDLSDIPVIPEDGDNSSPVAPLESHPKTHEGVAESKLEFRQLVELPESYTASIPLDTSDAVVPSHSASQFECRMDPMEDPLASFDLAAIDIENETAAMALAHFNNAEGPKNLNDEAFDMDSFIDEIEKKALTETPWTDFEAETASRTNDPGENLECTEFNVDRSDMVSVGLSDTLETEPETAASMSEGVCSPAGAASTSDSNPVVIPDSESSDADCDSLFGDPIDDSAADFDPSCSTEEPSKQTDIASTAVLPASFSEDMDLDAYLSTLDIPMQDVNEQELLAMLDAAAESQTASPCAERAISLDTDMRTDMPDMSTSPTSPDSVTFVSGSPEERNAGSAKRSFECIEEPDSSARKRVHVWDPYDSDKNLSWDLWSGSAERVAQNRAALRDEKDDETAKLMANLHSCARPNDRNTPVAVRS